MHIQIEKTFTEESKMTKQELKSQIVPSAVIELEYEHKIDPNSERGKWMIQIAVDEISQMIDEGEVTDGQDIYDWFKEQRA